MRPTLHNVALIFQIVYHDQDHINFCDKTMKTKAPQKQPHEPQNPSPLQSPPSSRRTQTSIELCKVIGDPHLQGTPASLQDLFGIVDLTAGGVAFTYSGVTCVAASYDALYLSPPCSPDGDSGRDDDGTVVAVVRHGDVVRGVGRPVHIGMRSIVIEVDLFIRAVGTEIRVYNSTVLNTRHERRLMTALITYVAKTDKPLLPLPLVNSDAVKGEDEKQLDSDLDTAQLKRQRNQLLQPTDRTSIGIATVSTGLITATKTTATPSSRSSTPSKVLTSPLQTVVAFKPALRATALTMRYTLQPKDLNPSGVLFGGNVVYTLTNVAMACAARAIGMAGTGLNQSAKPTTGRVRLVRIKALSNIQTVPLVVVFAISAVVVARRGDVACVFVRGFLESGSDAHVGSDDDVVAGGVQSYFYHQRISRTLSHSGLFFVRMMGLSVLSERSSSDGVVDTDVKAAGGDGVMAIDGSGAQDDDVMDMDMDEESFGELFQRAMSICKESDFENPILSEKRKSRL